ncbi:MAG: PAS domain-containing protein [Syntrophales bacterium]|nr:PAS domain-containing protein [Syntrophales bacterium]
MPQRFADMGDIVASILEAIPSPILVVDDDVRIIGVNQAASDLVAQKPEMVIRRRAGEVLHCLHATENPEGCGRAESCHICPVRQAVTESFRGQRVVRKRARMELVMKDRPVEMYLLVTTAPFTYQSKSLVILILEDISELMELKSILPICAQCKRIRNDQEYWQCVESYFKSHLDLDFSHGICPECAKELYPDLVKD